MNFKIEECKRGNWQVKEKIVLDIGTFYLLEDANGFYRNKQLADGGGNIVRAWLYLASLGFYASVTRWTGDEFEKAFSAAYRRRAIDEFRKAFPVTEKYFFRTDRHKNETEEEAKERGKARYEKAENSLEVAAFAYKKLGMNPYDAFYLFGEALLGYNRPICGAAEEDFMGYSRDAIELLEKVWSVMCEMQEAYDKGVFEYPYYD